MTHGEKEREGRKEPFWVLGKNEQKKGKKTCSLGGWLSIKK
jgi:hypothetical protein